MMVSSKRVLGGFVMLAALMAVATSSDAQPTRVQPATVGQLKLKPITVSPDLKQALAKKAKFDQPSFAQRITYLGGSPQLKVKSGRQFLLEPVDSPQTPPASLQMTVLPASIAQYKPHVDSPWVIGRRVPQLVDLVESNLGQQTPVKDQGPRGTCTAFASIGGLEARGKREGHIRDLSENHAFNLFMTDGGLSCSPSQGYWTWKTGPELTEHGVCLESQFAYTSSCPGATPAPCSSNATAKFTSTAHFFTPEHGGQGNFLATNTNLLEAFIKAGHDVVYGLSVAGNDWSGGDGIIDVQVDSNGNPAPAGGGHAMLIVGYNRTQNYFIVKNSWGTDWGHSGYAWISYEYLQTYGKYGYAVLNATVP